MEIVRVAMVASGRTASRSALAARLTAGAAGSPGVARPTVRSWPEANCTAPSVRETASAAKIPVTFCDMAWSLAPEAIGDSNVSLGRRVLGRVDHITVCEKILTR